MPSLAMDGERLGVLLAFRSRQQENQTPLMAVELQLESGSAFQIHLLQFEGPLDVLLHLIREQELDIHDIPIAQVTEQYLEFLRRMEELDLAVAGEYLVIAATLIEIKSSHLLPRPAPPEDEDGPDPRDELVRRLLEYEKYKEVAQLLKDSEEERHLLYSRTVGIDADELPPVSSDTVTTIDLLAALRRVLEDVGEGREPITTVPRQKLTLRMKMSEINRRVRQMGRLPFSQLFMEERTRAEVVVAFLALLELLRLRRIVAEQAERFGEIYLLAAPDEEQV